MVLLISPISNIPFYILSLFELPKGPLKNIDLLGKMLLWQDSDDAHKYHLVNWKDVCQPDDHGGLGVVYLEDMNICSFG